MLTSRSSKSWKFCSWVSYYFSTSGAVPLPGFSPFSPDVKEFALGYIERSMTPKEVIYPTIMSCSYDGMNIFPVIVNGIRSTTGDIHQNLSVYYSIHLSKLKFYELLVFKNLLMKRSNYLTSFYITNSI